MISSAAMTYRIRYDTQPTSIVELCGIRTVAMSQAVASAAMQNANELKRAAESGGKYKPTLIDVNMDWARATMRAQVGSDRLHPPPPSINPPLTQPLVQPLAQTSLGVVMDSVCVCVHAQGLQRSIRCPL